MRLVTMLRKLERAPTGRLKRLRDRLDTRYSEMTSPRRAIRWAVWLLIVGVLATREPSPFSDN